MLLTDVLLRLLALNHFWSNFLFLNEEQKGEGGTMKQTTNKNQMEYKDMYLYSKAISGTLCSTS